MSFWFSNNVDSNGGWIGLLSVATLTTDFLMEYVMPLKNAYIKYKYKETAHHDTLRNQMTQRQLDTLDVSHDTDADASVNNARKNKSDEYGLLNEWGQIISNNTFSI